MIRPRYLVLREPVIAWAAYYADGTVLRSRFDSPADVVDGVQALAILSRRADGKTFVEMHHGEDLPEVTYDIPIVDRDGDGTGVYTVRSGPTLADQDFAPVYDKMLDEATSRQL